MSDASPKAYTQGERIMIGVVLGLSAVMALVVGIAQGNPFSKQWERSIKA